VKNAHLTNNFTTKNGHTGTRSLASNLKYSGFSSLAEADDPPVRYSEIAETLESFLMFVLDLS
jgi:hypothetical protein